MTDLYRLIKASQHPDPNVRQAEDIGGALKAMLEDMRDHKITSEVLAHTFQAFCVKQLQEAEKRGIKRTKIANETIQYENLLEALKLLEVFDPGIGKPNTLVALAKRAAEFRSLMMSDVFRIKLHRAKEILGSMHADLKPQHQAFWKELEDLLK
jgi:hypothetical protein